MAGFTVSLLAFAIMTYIASQGKALGWEASLFHVMNAWPDGLRTAMLVITFFGSTLWAPVIVGCLLLMKMYRLAWRLAATIIGSYGIVFIVKHVIERERPLGLLSDVNARIAETGMGFPSGHATLVTVVMLTLLPYIARRWQWLIVVPIALICVSRLYLGVHVPLDVLGGVALGTAAVTFVRILPKPLRVWLRID